MAKSTLSPLWLLLVPLLLGSCSSPGDKEDKLILDVVCAGGTGQTNGSKIVSMEDGGFLVAGSFGGTVVFGPGEPEQTSLTSIGGSDVFLARYNRDKTLAWASWAFGAGDESVSGLIALEDGSIFLTGEFGRYNQPAGTIAVFGPGETNETALTVNGASEMFLAKYDADGKLLWARQSDGSGMELSQSVSAMPDGSALVVGNFGGTMTLGAGEPNQTRLTANSSDMFLARYAPQGSLDWAFRIGAAENDGAKAVFSFDDESFLLAGYFERVVEFNRRGTEQTFLTAEGGPDIFLAKYSADTSLEWIRREGGIYSERVNDISVDTSGGFAVTGYFGESGNRDWKTTTLGPGEPNETVLEGDDQFDALVARFQPDGSLVWAQGAISLVDAGPSSTTSHGYGLVLLDDGSVVITGEFMISVTLDWNGKNEVTLTSSGGDDLDLFVARYGPDGSLEWARRAGGDEYDRGNDITVWSDGSLLLTGRLVKGSTFGLEDEEILDCQLDGHALILNIDP